jgi:hypothetical protein
MMRLAVTTKLATAGLAVRNDSLAMTSDRVGTILLHRTPLFIALHYIITWPDLPKKRSPGRGFGDSGAFFLNNDTL